MTESFGTYAKYYDLLYKDKDYAAEADYIHSLLQRFDLPPNASILELGSGTGIHAKLLARMGYKVHGVERSKGMYEVASMLQKRAEAEESLGGPTFALGDARSYRSNKYFDAVISLFHVISYQTSNCDLEAVFKTAKQHLRAGGIFIFDCWYGPAVLSQRPEIRVKELQSGGMELLRIATPIMHPNENRVDVNYHIIIKETASGTVEELRETHSMRYLFCPELEKMLADVGMRLIAAEEWMTGVELGVDTWGALFIAQ